MSCNIIQDMLMLQKNINWNDFPADKKRGSCVVKEERFICQDTGEEIVDKRTANWNNGMECLDNVVKRTHWIIDRNIPIFKGEDREYIEKLIYIED